MGKVHEEKKNIRSNSKAPYIRNCKCLLHDPTSNSPLSNTSGKDLRKSELNWLIENDFIAKRAKWVCRNCLLFARAKLHERVTVDINVADMPADRSSEYITDDENTENSETVN